MHGVTARDLAAYGLGFATPFVGYAAFFFWEYTSRTRSELWDKRPIARGSRFVVIRFRHGRITVRCRRCDWTATGSEKEMIRETNQHRCAGSSRGGAK